MRHCHHCGHHHVAHDHTPRCGAYTTDHTGFHKCMCDGQPQEQEQQAA